MKTFLIFIFLQIYIYGFEILSIENQKININTIGYTYFLEETPQLNNAEIILHNPHLQLSKTNYIGIKSGPYWGEFTLKNTTDESIELVLSCEHSGVNYLDVYVYKGKNLESKYFLGDMREQKEREIIYHNPVITLKLSPNESKTILSRYDNSGMYKINWSIQDTKTFINNDNKYILFLILLSGFTFFLSFNSLYLYSIYKVKTFLITFTETIFTFLYILALNGYLYQMDIGIPLFLITMLAWVSLFIVAIMRLSFPLAFFHLQKEYKKTTLLIYFFIGLFVFGLFLSLYTVYLDRSFIGKFETLLFLLFTIYTFVLVGVGIFLAIKKIKWAKFYLLIQLIVTFVSTLHTLNILNIIHLESFNPYLMHTISILDALLLLLLQYKSSKEEYQQKLKQNDMLLDQSRFYSVGQAVGHIAHQWKYPLSRISGTVTTLDFKLQKERDSIPNYLESKMDTMKNAIDEMKFTVDNFMNIYSVPSKKDQFNIYDLLKKNVIGLLDAKLKEKNITLEIDIDPMMNVKSYKHIISNILIILIDNSTNAFSNNHDNNWIKISAQHNINDTYTIIYKDNAGGIKIEPIESVFDYFISTKKDIFNSGIGLPLFKILVTDKLEGNFEVKNDEDGVVFTIRF